MPALAVKSIEGNTTRGNFFVILPHTVAKQDTMLTPTEVNKLIYHGDFTQKAMNKIKLPIILPELKSESKSEPGFRVLGVCSCL